MPTATASFVCVLALALAGGAACGGGRDRVVVFAASSLTQVFDRLEREFETDHPGVDVVVNYDGSAGLAAQIEQGAPVDVFASADLATMERVAGIADGRPTVFARNRLSIAVEAGNPLGLEGLADLADDGLIVVLAAPEVPVGAYAVEALGRAGVVVRPDSLEQNVRAVAAKVALGEADAGIVYRTDVRADDRLDEVAIPDPENVSAEYPIVVVRDGRLARELVDFLLGDAGRRALSAEGFEAP